MTNFDLLDEIEKLKKLKQARLQRSYQLSKLNRFKHELLVLHRMGETIIKITDY